MWPVVAPVSAIAPAPVFLHVGAMITVSPGWNTPLPAGSNASACGATETALTVRVIAKLWVSGPLTPWAWKLYVPAGRAAPTVTVSVLVALPLAGGVDDGGL